MIDARHEEVQSLLGAYVLGAVSEEEAAAVGTHVRSCPECQAEIATLSSAVELLATGVEPLQPPNGFTERVLQRAVQERDAGRSLARPRVRGWQRWAALAAALAIFAGLSAYAIDVRNEAAAQRRIASALVRAAEGADLEGPAGVAAKVVPTDSGGIFVATGLEDPGDDRVYQLWFLRDGTPISGGTFGVSYGVAVLRTSRSPNAFDAVAVTVEPAGGSRRPTTSPLLSSA